MLGENRPDAAVQVGRRVGLLEEETTHASGRARLVAALRRRLKLQGHSRCWLEDGLAGIFEIVTALLRAPLQIRNALVVFELGLVTYHPFLS